MKKSLFLLFVLISVQQVMAQGILSQTGGKIYIGGSIGPSFPIGDFGETVPDQEKSGYATTGYKVEVDAGVRLFNLLEVSAVGFRNINETNPDNLKNYLVEQYPSADFNVESDDWEIYGFLGGIGLSYPLPNKFIADIRILGGYMNITSPNISLTTANPGVYYKVESSTTSSFVYLTSASLRYPVLKRLYISLGFDYIGSSADFKDVTTIRSFEGNTVESKASFEQTMDSWALTVGFKFFIL